jgi:hypothetical protein
LVAKQSAQPKSVRSKTSSALSGRLAIEQPEPAKRIDISTGSVVRYGINTISWDPVLLGFQGGFTQADYGASFRLAPRKNPFVFI